MYVYMCVCVYLFVCVYACVSLKWEDLEKVKNGERNYSYRDKQGHLVSFFMLLRASILCLGG